MKYHKIVLAGGNGYLGTVLAKYYKALAEDVITLSRQPKPTDGDNPGPGQDNIRTIAWDGKTRGDWTRALENADLLVNLCGKNVNCRYTNPAASSTELSATFPPDLIPFL